MVLSASALQQCPEDLAFSWSLLLFYSVGKRREEDSMVEKGMVEQGRQSFFDE
jgi:hypothetical protein